jgi:hypothetical protein
VIAARRLPPDAAATPAATRCHDPDGRTDSTVGRCFELDFETPETLPLDFSLDRTGCFSMTRSSSSARRANPVISRWISKHVTRRRRDAW